MKKIAILCFLLLSFGTQIFSKPFIGSFSKVTEKETTLLDINREMEKRLEDYEKDLEKHRTKGNTEKEELDKKDLKNDLNSKNKYSLTPIFYAIELENTRLVGKMLQYGADPNICDSNGTSPLFFALENRKNPEIIKMLLNYGADANLILNNDERSGFTPLHAAIFSENSDIIKLVLDKTTIWDKKAKFKFEEGRLESTPFALLCYFIAEDKKAPEKELLEIVDQLIEKGIDINSEIVEDDDTFCNPLQLILRYYSDNKYAFVEKLIESGADVNNPSTIEDKKTSSIDITTEQKSAKLFKLILNKANSECINMEIVSENFKYSLLADLLFDYDGKDDFTKEAIKELIEKGANTNIPYTTGIEHFHPLFLVVKNDAIRNEEKYALIKNLLSHGADCNKFNNYEDWEFSTFHYVSKENNEELYKLFAENKGDKKVKDNCGKSVLDYKKEYITNEAEKLAFSYSEGEKINADDYKNYEEVTKSSKMNMAQIAIMNKDSESAKYFLGKISWEKEDKNGKNALDYAVHYKDSNLIQYFIEKKVNVGETIFAIIDNALEDGNIEPLRKFLEFGDFTNVSKRHGDNNVLLDPIVYASLYGPEYSKISSKNRENVVSVLLENSKKITKSGINSKITKDGKTPILITDEENIALKLIDYGAAVDITDNEGKNAIEYAFEKNQTLVLEKLIDNKTKIGRAIFSAIDSELSGNDAKLKEFMELEGSQSLSKLTKEELYENKKVKMPLMVYATCTKTGDNQNLSAQRIRILQKILEAGSDINAKILGGEYNGDTSLIFATRNNDYDLVKFLLEKEADAAIQSKGENYFGRTALFYALENKNEKICSLLINSLGENLSNIVTNNMKDKGASLLMFLARYGTNDMILDLLPKFLEKDKYCLERVDMDGKTAFLYAAAYNPEYKVIKYFRMYGAEVQVKDKNGNNAFDLAKLENNSEEVLRRLESYGVYGK